ncbi:MAG: response regulator transcription factor [Chitinophagaceae bacterium]|nr:response regulator transcription factor [Chitinophagaceae bacterium]MCW5926400.1 response regulator transcription factor [Chitinophagaceae bacterium]
MQHSGHINQHFSCIVVDDDEIDRLTVLAFLSDYPHIKVIGSFYSPFKALEAIAATPPDALFLDVDMPGMNGLQLREKLVDVPACVFITSYPDYAVESFEKEVLDFIVKPVTAPRFAKTIQRLEEYLLLRKKADLLHHTIGADTIFIREGHAEIKLQLHDILYLEAMKDYTAVMTAERRFMVATPMGSLIQTRPFEQFIRIHRSYAVPKHFIRRVDSDELELENAVRLPIGRTYKEALTGLKT